jgi:predicted AlkP superfamily pyrophosphatase or phosphodiesterase
MFKTRFRGVPLLAVLLTSILLPVLGQAQPSPENRLVLLSIDGLSPDLLSRAEEMGIKLPALDALRSRGVTADGLIGIFPTVTYPLHTTLITGVTPDRHGVTTNYKDRDWYLDRSDIRVDTLWDAAERADLTTAVVSWPVSFGAEVDFLVPEYLAINADPMPKIRSDSTPGLLDSLEETKSPLPQLLPFRELEAGVPLDTFTTEVACWVLETEKPDLLFTHFLDLDHRRHRHGPFAEPIFQSLRFVDVLLSRIVEATEQAGTRESTTFVVVGDHGFEWIHTTIVLDALFAGAGIDASRFKMVVEGGSAAVYPTTEGQAGSEHKVDDFVSSRLDGLVMLVDREQLDRLGAYPGALFSLEAAPGYSLGRGETGDDLLRPSGGLGSHGFLPSRDRMHAAFVAAGPAVAERLRGVRIPRLRMIDVAPTLAAILGLELRDATGLPVVGLINYPH